MRYIVKHMQNGDIGVFDRDRGCFPNAGPELRKIGVAHVGWLHGKEGEEEAERIAALLNGLTASAAKAAKATAEMGKAAKDAEQSLRAMADVLIEDEKKARASV